MASGNSSFSAVVTRTLQAHGNEIFDAVSTNNAFLWLLRRAGNIKISSGGRTFTHPIIFATNSSFKMYTKFETISTPDPDLVTRAEYAIRIPAGSIVLSWLEEAQNAGVREKLLDYADEKRKEAIISMGELMGDQTTGVEGNNTAPNMGGITHLISDTPSTQTNVGGIDASASGNTYWRNTATTTTVTAFNTASEGLTAMDTLLNATTFGRQGPRAVITTKAIWSLYQVGQAANIRYAHADLADAGFRSLDYAGMPVLFDDNIQASHLYMVDTDSLWLQVLRRGNNQLTEFRSSTNQLSDVALMYLFGNLTTGSRRTQGVLTAITG